MFLDIGWSEILVIGVVAIIAIGPEELPQVMRGLGRLVRRGQYIKFAMSRQFDDFMRQHELEELHKGLHPNEMFKDAHIDPDALTSVNFESRRREAALQAETDEEEADEEYARALADEKDVPNPEAPHG